MIQRFCVLLPLLPTDPVLLLAQEVGRGALRPYLHVFAAYGLFWVLILFWVWRIARGLKQLQGFHEERHSDAD